MKKIYVLMTMLATIFFMLSVWLIPVTCILLAAIIATNLIWVKIIAGVAAAIWLWLIKPWKLFKKAELSNFLDDLCTTIKFIIH